LDKALHSPFLGLINPKSLMSISLKNLLRFDWDIIDGILTAVSAIVPHMLHVLDVEALSAIMVVLLALLLLRDLRRENFDGDILICFS